jgi:hypothetical protein
MREKVRIAVVTLAIAAIGASVFIATPVVGRRDAGSEPAVLGDPWVKSGYKNGPVTVPKSLGNITSMALPAGKYTVFAKLWFEYSGPNAHLSDCKLTLGDSWDWVFEETLGHEAISLNVSGELTQAGRVYLACRTDTNGVSANWIKITAIRAGSLTNVSL